MVTTRRAKSSNEVMSSSEHEMENSPQIEKQQKYNYPLYFFYDPNNVALTTGHRVI